MNNKILTGISKDLKRFTKSFRKADGKWDIRKIIVEFAPYLLAAYLVNKICYGYRISPGTEFWSRVINLSNNFGKCFENPFPSLFKEDFLWGLLTGIGFKAFVIYKKKTAKHFRTGEEFGSAKWGGAKDIEPLMAEKFDDNIILTETERLRLVGRPISPEYDRNKNVLVIGGSGCGKTRFFVKPNLMQLSGSYVCTDPKGTLILETGSLFKRGYPVKTKSGKTKYIPYKIKVFNTIIFEESMHYNPFAYFRNYIDIQSFVNLFITNTKEPGSSGGEDFWLKAEKLLYVALISYIWKYAPVEEQNFGMLLDLIDSCETREEDETFENAVDLLFKDLEEEDPKSFSLRQYKKYKLSAGKTAKSILISCAARLAPFDIPEVREITSYDELHLERIGEERTILYVIISDMDSTFNFLVSIMYTQLFILLCDNALELYGGKLPLNVCFMLDEFANIGQIPDFDKKLTTIRSRGIYANVILQSKSQLESMYKDQAKTILENCDTTLFLGSGGTDTLKEIEERLGKETIDLLGTNISRGASESSGTNFSKTGRELMLKNELAVMSRKQCILFITGTRPFKSNKYDITVHQNYKYLSDYNPKNEFNVKKYLKTYQMPVLKKNTKIRVINTD